ncbi:MAG TPA: bifunctional heptose 7-phosphate kinase/heptose 1-phosphate adenyltransferase, partial [Candidatus Tenderia sp.]|nr:bifunctional heptose 7-phosphate kinase/heptose 1-phosphate adenyltransferase [Candidatus Tenderia sp.]
MKFQLPDFASVRILVAGDLMLDRYWSGETSRISPEAPVPVVRVTSSDERPGGAGNVALNIAALGAESAVLGVVGEDRDGLVLQQQLEAHSGLSCDLARAPNYPTVTKLRVLSRHQQLIRLDFEEPVCHADLPSLGSAFERNLGQADVVILSDYGKGALSDSRQLIARARAAGKPVLVDPKQRDFSHY